MNQPSLEGGLFAAVCHNEVDTVVKLLAAGADVNARLHAGMTPLMQAVRGGQWRVGQLLLACGADRERRDVCGRSAVEMARRAGNRRLFSERGMRSVAARVPLPRQRRA